MYVYGMVLDLRSGLSCNTKLSPTASFQGHIIHHSPKRVCSPNVLGYVRNVYHHVRHCVILLVVKVMMRMASYFPFLGLSCIRLLSSIKSRFW